jgi:hypothetical protein
MAVVVVVIAAVVASRLSGRREMRILDLDDLRERHRGLTLTWRQAA